MSDEKWKRFDIGPELPGGGRVVVDHEDDGSLKFKTAYPAKDGVPLAPGAEFAEVRRRSDGAFERRTIARGGPAMVNSQHYRDNWGDIFNAPGGSA